LQNKPKLKDQTKRQEKDLDHRSKTNKMDTTQTNKQTKRVNKQTTDNKNQSKQNNIEILR
jgi:hypothetical protein